MLVLTKRTDPNILKNMKTHYSQPKGFVGRNICYRVEYDGKYYGSIIGGSSTLHLIGRDQFFEIEQPLKKQKLKQIINNIFFHIEKVDNQYPLRNFSQVVMKEFRERVVKDWEDKYGDSVIGFETLVELPRTGELYLRDGWTEVGITKGYTCKRISGKGTDSWTGKRVWDTQNLRPKRVLCRFL